MASMLTKVKHAVSKKKRRFNNEGFDLDLSYITPQLIAMGFPAEKIEGMYRNHMEEVVRFFDSKHPDHYKVYNLCSERIYDTSRFHGRVALYQFDDHNAPPFELLQPFCADVEDFLGQDPKNVAVIHCKAGKGRTGVMICAFLLHQQKFSTYKDGLDFYGSKRTQNNKGVTIPSQRRYVKYYDFFVRNNLQYSPCTLLLHKLYFQGIPTLSGSGCSVQFTIRQAKVKIYTSRVYEIEGGKQDCAELDLSPPCPVCGDIKIEFFHVPRYRTEKMFHFWLNSFFIQHNCLDDNGTQSPHRSMTPSGLVSSAGICFTSSGDNIGLSQSRVQRCVSASAVGRHMRSSSASYTFPPHMDTPFEEVAERPTCVQTSESFSAPSLSSRAQLAVYQASPHFRVVTLPHQSLDKANKDKRHYPPNFKLHLVFSDLDHNVVCQAPAQTAEGSAETASSGSEEDLYNYSDTDPEDYEDWSESVQPSASASTVEVGSTATDSALSEADCIDTDKIVGTIV